MRFDYIYDRGCGQGVFIELKRIKVNFNLRLQKALIIDLANAFYALQKRLCLVFDRLHKRG